jgi:hypothetical protein
MIIQARAAPRAESSQLKEKMKEEREEKEKKKGRGKKISITLRALNSTTQPTVFLR